MARRLVTSSMTSRDSMTSYAWRHNFQKMSHSKTMARINYPFGSFKHTHCV